MVLTLEEAADALQKAKVLLVHRIQKELSVMKSETEIMKQGSSDSVQEEWKVTEAMKNAALSVGRTSVLTKAGKLLERLEAQTILDHGGVQEYLQSNNCVVSLQPLDAEEEAALQNGIKEFPVPLMAEGSDGSHEAE